MDRVIIEVFPSFGKSTIIDSLSVEVGNSCKGVDVFELLVIGEPADNFRYVDVFVSGDVSPDSVCFSDPDGFSFKVGKKGSSS